MEAVLKSAVWRRTSGITKAVEGTLPEDARRAGLARLVRQVMEVSVSGRKGFTKGDLERQGCDPFTPRSLRSRRPSPPQGERGGGGAGFDSGDFDGEGLGLGLGERATCDTGILGGSIELECATEFGASLGTGLANDRRDRGSRGSGSEELPDIEALAAVRGDCDPVGRVCAKLQISHGGLTGLMKEYCGLNTREVCDVARVHRIKPALRERVLRTALAVWGRPGLAAEMWCLRGGLLPKDAERVIREARLMRQRGRTNGLAEAQALAGFKPQTKAQFGPLHDPQTPREALMELLTEQLMNAVDAARGAADFNADAWAVELGFANFSRLKRACIVTFAKAPRQIEREFCRDVVEYWIAVESATLFELAKQPEGSAMVLRARWLFQGHEQPIAAGTISQLEWKRQADPVWVMEMEGAVARSTTG